MTDSTTKTPDEWRNFATHFPITACRLKRAELKQLYKIINEKQKEYRDKIVQSQSQTSQESPAEFEARKTRISDAFVVSVTITAENGERLTGNNEHIFDDINFPARPRSVFYSTQSVPQAVLGHLPQDRITLFLDFSQPPMVDFNRLPTLPTPNESNFEIAADNESWFAASKVKLAEFFDDRRSGYEWVHRAGVYDILLFLIGLPMAVWACARFETTIPSVDGLSTVPKVLAYAYVFVSVLTIFRVVFSYTRWVLPKIEIDGDVRQSPFRHRLVWVGVLGAVFGPVLYDVFRSLLAFLSK